MVSGGRRLKGDIDRLCSTGQSPATTFGTQSARMLPCSYEEIGRRGS